MKIDSVRYNVKMYLNLNNDDVIEAAKAIGKDYNRGIYTEEEYNDMMDMLAGYGITKVI